MQEKSIKITSKDDTMEKTIKYVEEIINNPETISLFHNDAWKIEAAE